MKDATDKGIKYLKKKIDSEKKARKAENAEMMSKMQQVKEARGISFQSHMEFAGCISRVVVPLV